MQQMRETESDPQRPRGDTRERLLVAAVQVMEEGGYAAASVAAIAARAESGFAL